MLSLSTVFFGHPRDINPTETVVFGLNFFLIRQKYHNLPNIYTDFVKYPVSYCRKMLSSADNELEELY